LILFSLIIYTRGEKEEEKQTITPEDEKKYAEIEG
jgi:hypothetical protein